jgi:hypothetical protein
MLLPEVQCLLTYALPFNTPTATSAPRNACTRRRPASGGTMARQANADSARTSSANSSHLSRRA